MRACMPSTSRAAVGQWGIIMDNGGLLAFLFDRKGLALDRRWDRPQHTGNLRVRLSLMKNSNPPPEHANSTDPYTFILNKTGDQTGDQKKNSIETGRGRKKKSQPVFDDAVRKEKSGFSSTRKKKFFRGKK